MDHKTNQVLELHREPAGRDDLPQGAGSGGILQAWRDRELRNLMPGEAAGPFLRAFVGTAFCGGSLHHGASRKEAIAEMARAPGPRPCSFHLTVAARWTRGRAGRESRWKVPNNTPGGPQGPFRLDLREECRILDLPPSTAPPQRTLST